MRTPVVTPARALEASRDELVVLMISSVGPTSRKVSGVLPVAVYVRSAGVIRSSSNSTQRRRLRPRALRMVRGLGAKNSFRIQEWMVIVPVLQEDCPVRNRGQHSPGTASSAIPGPVYPGVL